MTNKANFILALSFNMASGAKRAKVVLYTAEEAVRLLEEDMEEDSSNEGMSSGEESEIDRQLLHFSDESR